MERSGFVKDMLNWLLSDWFPCYDEDNIDFRCLDVARSLKNNRVRGLIREVVVELLANLTSLELRRAEYAARGLPPEHPRSSTSDDVESFISTLHQMLGDAFDTKSFYDSFPKIMNDYFKRINPDTKFFYWTGPKHRFRDFPLQSFNMPSRNSKERLDIVKPSRRADPVFFCANRAMLPVHNAATVRTKFHKFPETLPVPPDPDKRIE